MIFKYLCYDGHAMQRSDKLNIMRSKIMVDLMDGEVPCLRIEREFDAGRHGDLPDKVLQAMFQKLVDDRGRASSFLGCVKPNDIDSTFIVPLTLGDALEWMERRIGEIVGPDSELTSSFTVIHQKLAVAK